MFCWAGQNMGCARRFRTSVPLQTSMKRVVSRAATVTLTGRERKWNTLCISVHFSMYVHNKLLSGAIILFMMTGVDNSNRKYIAVRNFAAIDLSAGNFPTWKFQRRKFCRGKFLREKLFHMELSPHWSFSTGKFYRWGPILLTTWRPPSAREIDIPLKSILIFQTFFRWLFCEKNFLDIWWVCYDTFFFFVIFLNSNPAGHFSYILTSKKKLPGAKFSDGEMTCQ